MKGNKIRRLASIQLGQRLGDLVRWVAKEPSRSDMRVVFTAPKSDSSFRARRCARPNFETFIERFHVTSIYSLIKRDKFKHQDGRVPSASINTEFRPGQRQPAPLGSKRLAF
ncbi:Protein of unknown function [Pyronema omphalodes CBS 100304]|uniref:Uncharacterized protein n=1 Tax=Pyronema omphalodes (strain CBS 100304) TaxID=1076935 RepID=U4LE35_PYROM|nr:Protein of unknown function [Pyronema omphalodes CBS 100304]